MALSGLAPTYALIAASVCLSGLGVAAFHPEASRAANYASGERRATGMAIFSTGGNLGVATGPLVITPLVLAFGLKASLAMLLPMFAVTVWLLTQMGRLRPSVRRGVRPEPPGPRAPTPSGPSRA